MVDGSTAPAKDEGRFTKVPSELFERGRFLSDAAFRLFSCLLSFRNEKRRKAGRPWYETDSIFPSYRAIGNRIGFRDEKISRAINELETFGWLFRESRRGSRSRTPVYRVKIPDAVSPTKEQRDEFRKRSRRTNRAWSAGRSAGFPGLE